MGTYRKEIIADYKASESTIKQRIFRDDGLTFFEVEVGKKAIFHLKVIKASNIEATKNNVYWVAQAHKYFRTTNNWATFQDVDNTLELHELLTDLDRGTIYGQEYLEDGRRNPKYRRYTLESTKGVGKRYAPTNPYEDGHHKRTPEEGFFGKLGYITDKLGEGIWL
ncbi:hypothetical protein, partial [Aquimarina longa]|uniref:hypothetical protein n=1 Tax=Aquimarina longa TaxID=1080221 RepID=UPI00130E9A5F